MAEEEGNTTTISSRLKGYLRETPFFCKIIELVSEHHKSPYNNNNPFIIS